MSKTYHIVLILWLLSCTEKNENTPSAVIIARDSIAEPVADTTHFSTAQIANDTFVSDTFFIYREKTPDYYQAIYIEQKRTSKYYKWLFDFSFDKDEQRDFDSSVRAIRKNTLENNETRSSRPTREWLPLYRYKDKYYLYSPCDGGNTDRRMLTNSHLVYWYLDGPYPYLIKSVQQIDSLHFALTTTDYDLNQDAFSKPAEMDIHIIDPALQMAVFENKSVERNGQRYRLFVTKSGAKHFDMIVNYCQGQKMREFSSEDIDFEKLMGSARNKEHFRLAFIRTPSRF